MRGIISLKQQYTFAEVEDDKPRASQAEVYLWSTLQAIFLCLALVVPSSSSAQQSDRDASLRSLLAAYTLAATNIGKIEDDDDNQTKYRHAMAELLALDDQIQGALDGATPNLRQSALWEIAKTRLGMEYRDPVSIAEKGMGINDVVAGRLALAVGQFSKAIRILSQSHDSAASNLRRKAIFAQSVILADSPKPKCNDKDDICQMLYSLLAGAPADRAGMYEDFLGKYKAKRSSTSADPQNIDQRSLIEFLISDKSQNIPSTKDFTQSTQQWKSKTLTSNAIGRFINALTEADPAQGGPKIIDFLIHEPATAAILATNLMQDNHGKQVLPKMELGAARKPDAGSDENSDSDNILDVTLEDRFAIGARHFFVVKIEGLIEGNVVVFEAPSENSSKLWYWVGGTGGGGVISARGSLSTVKDLVLVTKTESSAGFLTLWIVDSANRRTTQLFNAKENVEEAYHGQVFFPDLDGSGSRKIFASFATGDRRYSDCNQCPSRRESLVFDYVPANGSLNLLGRYISWNEVGFGAHNNLFGLGPEVTRNGLLATIDRDATSITQLKSDEPDHIVTASQEALGAAASLQESQSHAEAAAAALRIQQLLKAKGEFEGRAEQMLFAAVVAASAYLSLGQTQDALQILKGYDQNVTKNENLRSVYMNLQYVLARNSGGIASQFDTLQNITREFPDELRGGALLADYLLDVGDLDQALLTARAVSDQRSAKGEAWTDDVLTEATALARSGRYESALTELAVLLREEAESPDSSLSAKALLTAGDIAIRTENFDAARYLIDSSIAQMDAQAWSEQAGAVLTLYGRLLRSVGNLNGARRVLAISLRLFGTREDLVVASAADEMASVLDGMGRHDEAVAASTNAFRMLISEQTEVSQETYKLSFVSSAAEIAERHISRLLNEPTVSPADLVDALERWRAQVLRSLRRNQISSTLLNRSPSAEIAGFALGQVAYVTYYIVGGKTIAVICEDGHFRMKTLPIGASELDQHRQIVRKFTDLSDNAALASIFQDSVPPELKASLTALYSGLIELLDLVPSSKIVYIVPDEKLYWVPWAALNDASKSAAPGTDSNHLRSVFEDLAILVTPTALLSLDDSGASAGSHAVSIGSSEGISVAAIKAALPDLYLARDPRPLEGLRSAPQEASEVAKALSQRMPATVISVSVSNPEGDRDAAVTSILKAVSNAAIVHIAAHGIFDANNPMASAIFLSSSPAGVLRPSDFPTSDLSKTSLVSLSACETGVNDVKTGGEAIGFVRGILLAGAQRVLLTQWKVEDRSAREFFQNFYTQFAKTGDYVQAYRSAVLQSVHRYAHPFYWGGFAMYSNVPK